MPLTPSYFPALYSVYLGITQRVNYCSAQAFPHDLWMPAGNRREAPGTSTRRLPNVTSCLSQVEKHPGHYSGL